MYKRQKFACLRYFNPIGAHPSGYLGEDPFGTPNNIFPLIMNVALGQASNLEVYGNDWNTPDGTCIRDYIHVMDLADGHIAALNYLQNNKPQILNLNIGTGKGHSVLEVIETFKREVGVKLNFKIGNRRAGDVPSIYADNKKIVALLGWKPRYSLADALVHAWKWEQEMKKHIG